MDVTLGSRADPDPLPPPAPEGAGPARRVSVLRPATVLLLAVGVAIRFVTPSHLWLDEALTVNISRLPLDRMVEALRHDGAPPLFYALLHGWITVFGDGDVAVRALPGLFAVAALPLAWLAGRRIGGRDTAWAALVLLAASPFAVRYATEARMYSLVVLLVLVGFVALDRVLTGGGRAPVVVLAATAGALLLTHYWSFYLAVLVGLALVVRARRARRRGDEAGRRRAVRALVAVAAGSLAFLPWLPSFLFQVANTGTPWGRPPLARTLADTVFHFAGGYWDPALGLGLMYWALMALAVWGRPVDGTRIELDLRGRPPARELALVLFGTLALSVVAGQASRAAYAVRYASVVFPVALLLVALGVSVLADRRLRMGVLTAAAVLGLAACLPGMTGERTSAGRVAAALRAQASPGDVVAYCPDQLGPAVSRLLPEDRFVQVTFPRATPPQLIDWVGYEEANRNARTAPFARMLLERAGPDHDVWVVWAPGYRTYGTRCQLLLSRLKEARPDETRVVRISPRHFESPGLVRYPPP